MPKRPFTIVIPAKVYLGNRIGPVLISDVEIEVSADDAEKALDEVTTALQALIQKEPG